MQHSYLKDGHRAADPHVLLADYFTVVHLADADYVMHIPEQPAAIGQPICYSAWMIPGTWRD